MTKTIDPTNTTTTCTVSDITEESSVTSGYHLMKSTTSRATVRPALAYSMYENRVDMYPVPRYQIPSEQLLRKSKGKKHR